MKTLLLCGFFANFLAAAPRIAHADVEVGTSDGGLYSVRMKMELTTEAWSTPSFTLEHDAGSRIYDLHAGDLQPALQHFGAVDRLVLAQPLPAGAFFEISYSVAMAPGARLKIPLAVPEIPFTGAARGVEIHISPQAGYLRTGDAFPAFTGNTAEVANLPGHIEIEIGKQPRRSIPALLSDFGVVLLLAGGTAIRGVLRRKGPST